MSGQPPHIFIMMEVGLVSDSDNSVAQKDFENQEIQKEYELEVVREKARWNVYFEDPRIKWRDIKNRHISFLYTVLVVLFSASVGYLISYFGK